uniref:Uncharacterized protein n=1 Tax=Pectobacterium phage Amona TaxID=3158137 RepID=A0AB39ABG5_9CAUD
MPQRFSHAVNVGFRDLLFDVFHVHYKYPLAIIRYGMYYQCVI